MRRACVTTHPGNAPAPAVFSDNISRVSPHTLRCARARLCSHTSWLGSAFPPVTARSTHWSAPLRIPKCPPWGSCSAPDPSLLTPKEEDAIVRLTAQLPLFVRGPPYSDVHPAG